MGRLDKVGYEIGVRILELLSYREKLLRRKPECLDILRFIHSTVWPYLFGKNADDLQQAAAVRAWSGLFMQSLGCGHIKQHL